MIRPNSHGEVRPGATAAQLAGAIDAGRMGDKVGGFDPAAAPLGCDAEAGGAPTSASTLAAELAEERRGGPDSGRANAATPELAPDGRLPRQRGLVLALLAGAVVALLLAVLLYAVL